MKKFITSILTLGLSFSLYSSQEAIQKKSQALRAMKNSKNYIQELQSTLKENKKSISGETVIANEKDQIRNAIQKEIDRSIEEYNKNTSILVSIFGEEILQDLNNFNSK